VRLWVSGREKQEIGAREQAVERGAAYILGSISKWELDTKRGIAKLKKLFLVAAATLAATSALANDIDDEVAAIVSLRGDVPVFSDYLKAEQGKGNVEGNFYIDPKHLEIYVNVNEKSEHPGSPSELQNARKWGHQFCTDMSKSQHDRSSFIAWHIYVMVWQGPEDGGPNVGYDPVYKCTLGGKTAKEVPIAANPNDYVR
jgi:hypothetical protein